jgi:hypothetical protein
MQGSFRLARSMTGRVLSLLSLLLWLPCAANAQLHVSASPDVATDLSGAPVRDREAAVDDLAGGLLIEDFGGLPEGADVSALHEELNGSLLFASDVSVSLPGGVTARPEDVALLAGGVYGVAFDGAAAGVPEGAAVDAVTRGADGKTLLSFDVSVDLGGVVADDEDLVSFDGAQFALVFDGSAAGVDPALDLDGAAYAGEGRYALSFDGAGELGGVSFADEDVVTLLPDGTHVKLFFDASAQHVRWPQSDLDAVALPEPAAPAALAAGILWLAALARRGEKRCE